MSDPSVDSAVNIREYLDRRKEQVEDALDALLPAVQEEPVVLHEAMRYSIMAGGKRIRSILALAACEALDGDPIDCLYLAAALEMIHTYTLIHDDLPAMDDDDFRRGHPSCHKKYGEGVAVLAGNALLVRGFELVIEMPLAGGEPDTALSILRCLSGALGSRQGVIGGQAFDLATQGQAFDADTVRRIHQSKTASLIQASVSCGARVAGATPDKLARLESFGGKVGLAFQIIDDILDEEASADELGKSVGKDLKNRKATYPALFGIETSRQVAEVCVQEAVQELTFLESRGDRLKELARFVWLRRF